MFLSPPIPQCNVLNTCMKICFEELKGKNGTNGQVYLAPKAEN